jgi:cyclophilin family peptidyl-prolyl cis-trans isomerase
VQRRWRLIIAIGLFVLVIAGCAGAPPAAKPTEAKPAATTAPAKASPAGAQPTAKAAGRQWPAAPALTVDPAKVYTAVITTSRGVMTVELFAKETPITVNNFVFLAKEGFYEGVIFHRVIKGFMIQGGDPTGTGGGGPGYRFNDEPVTRDYRRGTLAMANAGRNTNGSQFFIVHQDAPQLPKNYVIFGQIKSGLEVLDSIANAPVGPGNSEPTPSRPVEPVQITKVEIQVE